MGTFLGSYGDSGGVTVIDAREDTLLVAALAEGDLVAMRSLYDRHAPWLSVRLARRCNDGEVVAGVFAGASGAGILAHRLRPLPQPRRQGAAGS